MFVLTADQKRSTRHGDRVPEALAALGSVLGSGDASGVALPFERTVGDEIQGVLGSPVSAVRAVTALVRLGSWRVGLGVGPVDLPLPTSTRAASGPAFLAAREAVEAARSSPADLRVLRGDGAHHYGEAERARQAESALWVLTVLLRRRTSEGWEIVDMAETGLSGRDIADRLDISPSAVSQRLGRAAYQEGRRGAELAEALLAEADA
ncbi:hypothetical protein [Phycicoccus sp. SLBN-51]|uniref:hypothetical protein n=1 Tax=Phycicoccus sp. SLBN-51 TaxID=2768447 RepID=UPI00114F5092|nr:hypothetical protein [Phycicoccus sp. SLBN-51]TQJ51367.1 hypothetical protein FBY26_3095 [Phycicoccus sp. SLBN-51]